MSPCYDEDFFFFLFIFLNIFNALLIVMEWPLGLLYTIPVTRLRLGNERGVKEVGERKNGRALRCE